MKKDSDTHDIDDDNPEWTDQMFHEAKYAREVLPEALFNGLKAEKKKRGERGQQKTPTKVPITLRLDPDIVDFFKQAGTGYQSRMNDALRQFIDAR